MSTKLCTIAITLCLTGLTPIHADTLYVDDDGSPGGDGTTWLSAFSDLQLALDAAKASGGVITEIHVAAGTYRPTAQYEPGTPRTESFQLINNLALKGGYRGCPEGDCTGDPDERDITQYETILTGDLEGNDIEADFPDGPTYEDNSLHVIYLPKQLALNETATLDGCTITAGIADLGTYPDYTHGRGGAVFLVCNSPTLSNCRFVRCHALYYGGAVYSEESSPEMTDCVVAENDSISDGAGVYLSSGSPSLVDCTIANNAMWSDYGGYGAGIATTGNCNLTLLRCLISGNQGYGQECVGAGGAFRGTGHQRVEECVFTHNTARWHGGGACLGAEDVTLKGCIIHNNHSYSGGGGICCFADSLIENCTISHNTSDMSGGGVCCYADSLIENCTITHNTSDMSGGGLFCYYPGPTLVNCLIASNAANKGGAVFSFYSVHGRDTKLLNCTLVGNSAEIGGAVDCDRSNPILTNCIVWDNQPAALSAACGDAQITYSNIQGGWPGPGNINADPRFALEADYHLMVGSPCIDTGKDAPCMGFPVEDLEGGPRVVDGNLDGIASIDMGAYECSRGVPILAVSPDVLTCYVAEGEVVAHTERLQILNAGMDYLNWEIHEDCPWLSVLPQSGMSGSMTSEPEASEVIVTFDAGDLTPGQYEYALTITSPDAYNSPRTVRIIMEASGVRRVPADYPTIQEAIDAAEPTDTVLIADGTYTGPGNRDLDFLGKPITVRSENGPEGCIIDCERQGRGFAFRSGETNDARLQGLTIRGGYVDRESPDGSSGGGILCYDSSPTITECVITDNHCDAYGGGGIALSGETQAKILDCEISYNSAYRSGGGVLAWQAAAPEVRRCVIHGNTAMFGGGIGLSNWAPMKIIDCTICDNMASIGGGAIGGHPGGQVSLSNCILARNVALFGAAIDQEYGRGATVSNCTIVHNRSAGGSGAIRYGHGDMAITNTIVYDNYPRAIVMDDSDSPTVTFSNIKGGWEGEGNIDEAPLFAFDHEYHLSAESPCIDAGSNASVPEETSDDIDGNRRLHDGDADGSAVVDIGAHEFNTLVPSLALSEELIEISIPIDDPSPKTVTLGIRNSGGGTLDWQISEDADWLTADTLTGSSTGEVDEVLLTIDPAGLEVGTYECRVTIAAPGYANEQRIIRGYLYVHRVLRVPSQYATISAALRVAESHDIVLVADGVYGSDDEGIRVGNGEITVRSENGPEHCVIDCEYHQEGVALGVGEDDLWESSTTSTAPSFICYDRDSGSSFPYLRGPLLQGLTIQNASAGTGSGGGVSTGGFGSTIRNCVIRNCTARQGGGIAGYGFPTIEDCLITRCTAGDGGGIYCDSGTAIRQCEISMNTASSSGGGVHLGSSDTRSPGGVIEACHIHHNIVPSIVPAYGKGGGVYACANRSKPLIKDCVIEDNVCGGHGGGVFSQLSAAMTGCLIRNNIAGYLGGGIYWGDRGTMQDCRVEGNTSGRDGGGLYQVGTPRVPTTRCDFINNTAAGNGGGIFSCGRTPQLAHSLIAGNTAGGHGGAIHVASGDITLTNCTVANNTADTSGGGLYQAEGSTTTITNSVFHGDTPGELVFVYDAPDVRYSLIAGGWEGEGNIDADPVFAFTEDYHILPTSPCIDAGEALSESTSVFDLDGNPRPLDGDQDGTAAMDIGAFEFDPNFPSIAVSRHVITLVASEEPAPFIEEVLSIRNAGGGTLAWQIVCDTPGLEITPATGTSTGEINDILLKLDLDQWPADQNETWLTVSCPEAINSPVDILLRFEIPQERHVPADYPTIQDAIDVAGPGDTIIIADGTYNGPGNRDIDFLGKPITVRSENGPETCIIDCEHTTQAFRFMRTEGRDSVLDGITIQNGAITRQGRQGAGLQCQMSSPTIRNCIIANCVAPDSDSLHAVGGGLYCNDGSPLIEDCLFSGNVAPQGGGSYCSGSGSPEIRRCRLEDNTASPGGASQGAGIFVTGNATPFIVSCEIVGNTAENGGGGGIFVENRSAPIIVDCRLHANTARTGGAGLYCAGSASLTVINTMITGNVTTHHGSRVGGGGVYCGSGSSPTLINCLISGNGMEAEDSCGGAIYTRSSALAVKGCTITDNYASIQGGAVFADEAIPAVLNSILWGNTPDQASGIDDGLPIITYSNIPGGFEGEGNIDADPLFLDPDGPDDDPTTWEDNDFRLAAGSPCIDAANNLAVPLDEFDLDADGDLTERIPFDFAGFARFVDDPTMTDTGIADPPAYLDIVDMGAYEYQPNEPPLNALSRDNPTDRRTDAPRALPRANDRSRSVTLPRPTGRMPGEPAGENRVAPARRNRVTK